MYIFIEGNIGSGKSTIIDKLEKYKNNKQYDLRVIREPVDRWCSITDAKGKNLLELFYSDKERYAFTLQSYVLITYYDILKKTKTKEAYTFVERSIWSQRDVFANFCYSNKFISDIDWKIYNKSHSLLSEQEFTKCVIVYVQTPPSVCMERIRRRERRGEQSINLDYLQSLHNLHETFVEKQKMLGRDVLYIDGCDEVDDICECILSYCCIAT